MAFCFRATSRRATVAASPLWSPQRMERIQKAISRNYRKLRTLPAGTLPPLGAIGWVHTHPYKNGDRLTVCPGTLVRFAEGTISTVYDRYRNEPSDYDGITSSRWYFGGYMIDKDKITEYIGDRYAPYKVTITSQVNRCGY